MVTLASKIVTVWVVNVVYIYPTNEHTTSRRRVEDESVGNLIADLIVNATGVPKNDGTLLCGTY